MSKEILLMADVPNLGAQGEIVSVTEGYARNYLLPRKLGAVASEGAKKKLAKLQKEREAALKAKQEEALARVGKFKDVSCTLPVKVTADDKLYGSVGVAEIAAALKAQGLVVAKEEIILPEPLRQLDVYDVKIRLHPEVETSVKVWVVKE